MNRFLLPPLALAAPFLLTPAFADPTDDRATALFKAAFSDQCLAAFQENGDLIEPPQRFDVTMPSSYGAPAPATLWSFHCNAGAYNMQQVYLIATELDGIRPLSFAAPALDILYEDAEDFESPVKSLTVAGWEARPMVVNSNFDPQTLSISEIALWRGIGDASNAASWRLLDGGFRLTHYEADASYDGEMEPQLVLDFP